MSEGSRLGRLRALARTYPPREALSDAWREHSRYVGFAIGAFVVGAALGIALLLAGVNLLELVLELFEEELGAEGQEIELTARFFVVNNSMPFLLSILGAVTLGLLTLFVMVLNGFVLGHLGGALAREVGVDFVVVGLAPHGIFELPALFVAAGVGFRLLHRFVDRIRGAREAAVSGRYLYRTAILVAVGWLLLVVAAVVEAHVTPVLLETFFAERVEEGAIGGTAASVAPVAPAFAGRSCLESKFGPRRCRRGCRRADLGGSGRPRGGVGPGPSTRRHPDSAVSPDRGRYERS